SSSWMIWVLPRTGPSRRCKLQLMTKVRLSSSYSVAWWIAPRDSGSSISPSPKNAQTCWSEVSLMPRISGYLLKRDRKDTPVPDTPRFRSLQLLDDLGVTTHRTIKTLQVTVNDESQVVQLI